ncbi:hypothetical protein [Blastococcus mobilis]|uniref:Lipoprotein n=1 Tax=Blastococcus mobilis TaxID=1938746 RepID=A0A238VX22_9ACTN|nr:hypothetical protein [Blastococcus mobilis]SNR38383.1 hypothetical protein SAMN06272737_10581 [Blastococcus mobilis]
MARPSTEAVRPALGRTACVLGLIGFTVTGCAAPRACTQVMYEPGVTVDLGGLDIDLRTADARICLDAECTDVPVTVLMPAPTSAPSAEPTGPAQILPERASVEWQRPVPDQDRVEVSLVLTDRVSGGALYRGRTTTEPTVREPNGPGCGEIRTLPPLTARPDGYLLTT